MGRMENGVLGQGLPSRREKLHCPRKPLLPFLQWDVSGRGPSYPHSKDSHFPEEPFGHMVYFPNHLRYSPANVSCEDIYSVGMISEDGSAWMVSCLDLAGTFSIYSNIFRLNFYEYWIIRVFQMSLVAEIQPETKDLWDWNINRGGFGMTSCCMHTRSDHK